MKEMTFVESEITIKAGQPTTLHLVNHGSYAHPFDMDEFDLHTSLAANDMAELSLTPEEPGHAMAGMVGTFIVEP